MVDQTKQALTTRQTHSPQRREAVAPVQTDKRAVFDHYWETRNLASVDLRTRLRIGIVEAMLRGVSGSLLDVGCGRGTVAAHFAESGFNVTGIDISPLAVRWTERQHPLIKAAVLDLESEPVTGEFDAILCLEVLQQVRTPVDVLCKLRDALAPGGRLIVSLPNEFHLARRLRILGGHVNFGGIEDTHIKLYTPREHHRLFAACGLVIDAQGTQSIIPPRWMQGRPYRWTASLARIWPSMFALSCVYRLSDGRADRSDPVAEATEHGEPQ